MTIYGCNKALMYVVTLTAIVAFLLVARTLAANTNRSSRALDTAATCKRYCEGRRARSECQHALSWSGSIVICMQLSALCSPQLFASVARSVQYLVRMLGRGCSQVSACADKSWL